MPASPYFGGDYFGQGDPPLNALHTMLQAGFVQAQDVMGSSAVIGSAGSVPIIVSAVDEKIAMEMEGYISDANFIGVVSTADFPSAPVENTNVTAQDGSMYLIRGIKSDPSSYVLALKKISI